MGLSMKPGAITLQRMPFSSPARAIARPSAICAALEDQ
jgi:hypothetical protein